MHTVINASYDYGTPGTFKFTKKKVEISAQKLRLTEKNAINKRVVPLDAVSLQDHNPAVC
jgi:hypothetical protein